MRQDVDGDENVVAGRDVITAHYQSSDSPVIAIQKRFLALNKRVKTSFGKVSATTSDRIAFDSERLFASLVSIGIQSDFSIAIALGIFPYIGEAFSADQTDEPFSTAHIRRAVSSAILNMGELNLSRAQRTELAAKYARNYGNPKHINMIVWENGATQPISYGYLNDIFLPQMISDLTGSYEKTDAFVSRNNYEHMASEIIESVRRLGVYHIRYETIRALSEDLATQLPHPWLPISRLRNELISHDIDRIDKHLKVVLNGDPLSHEFWRSAYECFNHCCSLILAKYNCPIGGGTYAPSNTLRNITRLRASGEHQNLALWDSCSLRFLDDDFDEHSMSPNVFHSDLKSLQKAVERMRFDRVEFVRIKLKKLSNFAKSIIPKD